MPQGLLPISQSGPNFFCALWGQSLNALSLFCLLVPATESYFERFWSGGLHLLEPGPLKVNSGHRWSWFQAELKGSPVGRLSSQEKRKWVLCSDNRDSSGVPVCMCIFHGSHWFPRRPQIPGREEWCVWYHHTSMDPPLPETSAAAVILGENRHT